MLENNGLPPVNTGKTSTELPIKQDFARKAHDMMREYHLTVRGIAEKLDIRPDWMEKYLHRDLKPTPDEESRLLELACHLKAEKEEQEEKSLTVQAEALPVEEPKTNVIENGNVKTFSHPQFGSVRTVEIDGEMWLVGKDVAESLGYTNPRKALIDHVDDEDKNTVTIRDGIPGNPSKVIINESGMYALVLSSKLQQAKAFKRWVTSDVLPSIRKHGMYAAEELLNNPDFLVQTALKLKEEHDKRLLAENQVALLSAKAEEDAPKVAFAEAFKVAETNITVRAMAKQLYQHGAVTIGDKRMGQNTLYAWLRSNGWCISYGDDRNQPTAKSMTSGYMVVKTTERMEDDRQVLDRVTRITPKGQIWLLHRFCGKDFKID